jgi:hypothetical protein
MKKQFIAEDGTAFDSELDCRVYEQKNIVVEAKKDINWDILTKVLLEYKEYVFSEEYHEDNDWEHIIYETAIDTVFGESFWEALRKRS